MSYYAPSNKSFSHLLSAPLYQRQRNGLGAHFRSRESMCKNCGHCNLDVDNDSSIITMLEEPESLELEIDESGQDGDESSDGALPMEFAETVKHDEKCQHQHLCPEAHTLAHVEKELTQKQCRRKDLCPKAQALTRHLENTQQAREEGGLNGLCSRTRNPVGALDPFRLLREREQAGHLGIFAGTDHFESVVDPFRILRERASSPCPSCTEDLEDEDEAVSVEYLENQRLALATLTEEITALGDSAKRQEAMIDELLKERAYLVGEQARLRSERSTLIEERWNLLNEREYLLEEQQLFFECQDYLEREMEANNILADCIDKDTATFSELLEERDYLRRQQELILHEAEERLRREMWACDVLAAKVDTAEETIDDLLKEQLFLEDSLERGLETYGVLSTSLKGAEDIISDILMAQEHINAGQERIRELEQERFDHLVKANDALVESLKRQKTTISKLLNDRNTLAEAQLILVDDRDWLLKGQEQLQSMLDSQYSEYEDELVREMAEDNFFAEHILQKDKTVNKTLEAQSETSVWDDNTSESENEVEIDDGITAEELKNVVELLDEEIERGQDYIRQNDEAVQRENLKAQREMEARMKALEERDHRILYDDFAWPPTTQVIGRPTSNRDRIASITATIAMDREETKAADAQMATEIQGSEISEKLAHLITTDPKFAEKVLLNASEIYHDHYVAEMAERDLASLSLRV